MRIQTKKQLCTILNYLIKLYHTMFWKLVLLNNSPKCNSMIKINFDWF